MVALRDRVRMPEAAAEGEALSADGPLPPYAEQAYADALLYLRRPREARAAYERVLAVTPKDIAARYGLFYAATELEDYTTAYATIDALVDDEPVWRTYKDDPTRYDNADRQYAEVTAAQARFYGNQLGEAWARITKIADAAPAETPTDDACYGPEILREQLLSLRRAAAERGGRGAERGGDGRGVGRWGHRGRRAGTYRSGGRQGSRSTHHLGGWCLRRQRPHRGRERRPHRV